MLHKVKSTAWMAATLICFTGTASIAWQNNPVSVHNHFLQDTTPKTENAKEDKTVINGDLDKIIDEVNRSKENLDKQLQNKDWEKWQKDLLKAQAELNTKNIHAEIENALKNIDLQKIQLETQTELRKADWDKMQKEMLQVQEEVKNNIDSKKMEMEVQRSMEATKKAIAEMKTINMEKIQQELEKTKQELALNEGKMQESLEKAKKEISENIHKDFRKELEKAQAGVESATEELRSYKTMLDEMAADGLLQSKEEYNIEYKNGNLFINGKQQPDNITNKYKHYFKKGNATIKRGKDIDGDKTIYL
ncbi:MAG: hypothetical protein ABJB86_01055 [Bacteroidota bacterium]